MIRIFEVQQDVLQKIQNEFLIQGLTRGRIESAIMIDLLLTWYIRCIGLQAWWGGGLVNLGMLMPFLHPNKYMYFMYYMWYNDFIDDVGEKWWLFQYGLIQRLSKG